MIMWPSDAMKSSAAWRTQAGLSGDDVALMPTHGYLYDVVDVNVQ